MRRMLVLVVLAAGLATTAAPPEASASSNPTVCLQPLGEYDARYLPVLARGVAYLYGLEVRTLDPRPLPGDAWYKPRARFRAEKILRHLDKEVVPGSGCDVVMGVTSEDISTTKGTHADWGMLGYAWIGGPSGVMSTHRVGAFSRRARVRAVKVMNHELGHALGLEHHDRDGCLMADVGGTVTTLDGESGLLCDESRRAIETLRGVSMPARTRVDWAAILRR